MIFTHSNSELHIETVCAILISRVLSSSPFFPSCSDKKLRECTFIWEAAVLILCRARNTLTIWFNKGTQAQASSTSGASVNACLSDH